MAVISLWNELKKENGQTSSMVAIATYLAVAHNYKILVIDATFHDNTVEKCFWKIKENKIVKKLNGGKLDISSGAEGLISAVSSNKATPEIITNYTKVVFKNRLDILLGLKTDSRKEHEDSLMVYKDLISIADKYYDYIFVDLSKGYEKPSTETLLKASKLILYTMPPNLGNIDHYLKLREEDPIVSGKNVLPLLSKSDEFSAYNVKNTTRYIKDKNLVLSVPYNVRFMESTNEASTAGFFLNTTISKVSLDVNGGFIGEVKRSSQAIIDKIKELNRGIR